MKAIKVNYNDTEYEIEFNQYIDGNTAILMYGTDKAMDNYMPATTNVSLYNAPSNVVTVDDWNGLDEALLEAGVIDKLVGGKQSGFTFYKVYSLTDKAFKQLEVDYKDQGLNVNVEVN